MEKYSSAEKKIDMYEIDPEIVAFYVKEYGQPKRSGKIVSFAESRKVSLTLVNVRTFKDGQINKVDTYIGEEGNLFFNVGHSEGLSDPGRKFSYPSYVAFLKASIGMLLECFFENAGDQLKGFGTEGLD